MTVYCIDPDSDGVGASGQADLEAAATTPYNTWAAAFSAGGSTNDNEFYQKRGTIASEGIGGVYRRLTFGAYSTGADPIVDGGDSVTSFIKAASTNPANSPVTISNFEIRNYTGAGIGMAGGTSQQSVVARNNTIHDCGGTGIAFTGDGSIIQYNTIYNVGNSGIQSNGNSAASADNSLIDNNTIYSVGLNDGIAMHNATSGGSNNVISNNTIYSIDTEDGIDIIAEMDGTIVENNTIYSVTTYGIVDKGSNSIIRWNHVSECGNAFIAAKGTVAAKVYGNICVNTTTTTTNPITRIGDLASEGINVEFYNNTIIESESTNTRRMLIIKSTTSGAVVKNNIFVTNDICISIDDNASDATIDYNIVESSYAKPYRILNVEKTLLEWQASGRDANGYKEDAMVSAAGFPSLDSPAKQAGEFVLNTKDYSGNPFAIPPTIGAYEIVDVSYPVTMLSQSGVNMKTNIKTT